MDIINNRFGYIEGYIALLQKRSYPIPESAVTLYLFFSSIKSLYTRQSVQYNFAYVFYIMLLYYVIGHTYGVVGFMARVFEIPNFAKA